MKAYALGHLRNVVQGPDIVEYLRNIDATLAPFGGRFIVHGGKADVLEGTWSGDLIIIEFPDRNSAHAWYRSDAYRRILPLRLNNAEGAVIIIEGVAQDHRALDVLAA